MTRELELLEQLHDELTNTTVEGSHFAKFWARVGLLIAAQIVEERRIEILVETQVLKRRGKNVY